MMLGTHTCVDEVYLMRNSVVCCFEREPCALHAADGHVLPLYLCVLCVYCVLCEQPRVVCTHTHAHACTNYNGGVCFVGRAGFCHWHSLRTAHTLCTALNDTVSSTHLFVCVWGCCCVHSHKNKTKKKNRTTRVARAAMCVLLVEALFVGVQEE